MGLFSALGNYERVYLPYLEQFNFYDGRQEWLRSIKDVPVRAVHLFAVHWLHSEVCNGGFWQYFHNSTGTSAPEAVDGFAAIGMPEVSTLIANAMRKLGEPYPGEKEERVEIVGARDNRMDFDELDRAFYDLAATSDFSREPPKFVAFADRYAAA